MKKEVKELEDEISKEDDARVKDLKKDHKAKVKDLDDLMSKRRATQNEILKHLAKKV